MSCEKSFEPIWSLFVPYFQKVISEKTLKMSMKYQVALKIHLEMMFFGYKRKKENRHREIPSKPGSLSVTNVLINI